MKKCLIALAFTAIFGTVAEAQTINALGAGRGSVIGADLFPSYQGANPAVRPSAAQIAAYVYGLMNGDCTSSGVGAIVCTKTNGTNFGALATTVPGTGVATFLATPSSANLLAALTTKTGTGNAVFGSAPTIDSLNATTAMTLAFLTGSTQCLQVNTSGVVSGTGAVCGGAGSSGANPTATAGPTAVNGVATTFLRSDGAPAVQLGTTSQKGIVQADGTTIGVTAGVLSNLGVTSVATSCGLTGGTITTTGTLSSTVSARNVTATSDTVTSADCGKAVTESNASPVAVAITTAGFSTGNYFTGKNLGAGVATYTPSAGTINGAATLVCNQNQSFDAYFDGTNFVTLANTCGASSTIFSGTATLGTSAIGSAACATAVTVAATGVATTDVVLASFNGDPAAVTGYVPLTTGMLTIIAYPTSGNAVFKVCNNTSASITPGAITLNVKVLR